MRIGVAEFLENVSKLKKKEEKISALRHNDSVVLRMVLQGAFDPSIKWALPEGTPPYKPNDLTDQEHVFIREHRKIPYFIEGAFPGLHRIKRETMFIELLEQVAPKDAEMLVAMKEKKLPYKGLTKDIVVEAFPDLIPNEQATNQKVS